MKTELEIKDAINKLEYNIEALKKEAGPFQTLSLYGLISGLKWVLDQPTVAHEIIEAIKKPHTQPKPYDIKDDFPVASSN